MEKMVVMSMTGLVGVGLTGDDTGVGGLPGTAISN